MPYEIRNFKLHSQDSFKDLIGKNYKFWQEQTFPDLYILKSNSQCIGVKFRQIDNKKYGYKIKSVEMKIDFNTLNTINLNAQSKNLIPKDSSFVSLFQMYQDWKKYQIDFKYRLYSRQTYANLNLINECRQKQRNLYRKSKKYILMKEFESEQQITNKINEEVQFKVQSFQNQIQHLNQALSLCIKQFIQKNNKLSNLLLYQNQLSNWAKPQNQIKELFLVRKDKQKYATMEYGKLKITRWSKKGFKLNKKDHKLQQSLFFQTFSVQNKQKQNLQIYIDKQFKDILNQDTKKQRIHNFQDVYFVENKQIESIINNRKGWKFKFNTSYPQLLNDIFIQFCTL